MMNSGNDAIVSVSNIEVTAFCLSFLCQLSQVLISARHSVTQSELEVHLSVKESFLKLFSNIIKK